MLSELLHRLRVEIAANTLHLQRVVELELGANLSVLVTRLKFPVFMFWPVVRHCLHKLLVLYRLMQTLLSCSEGPIVNIVSAFHLVGSI
jgi:hypothetical protein